LCENNNIRKEQHNIVMRKLHQENMVKWILKHEFKHERQVVTMIVDDGSSGSNQEDDAVKGHT
jgi:hypothetical protein